MPHVIVKMFPGRTEEQKQLLTAEITKAVMTALGSPDKAVSVAIEDVAKEDWNEAVYKPDIAARPEIIYKQPG
ncbi:tautomerase family protein [Acetobacteraceae bacterium H6797]|nr:tautomerase family protein [Acetobacteraceae bacterium H6797]